MADSRRPNPDHQTVGAIYRDGQTARGDYETTEYGSQQKRL